MATKRQTMEMGVTESGGGVGPRNSRAVSQSNNGDQVQKSESENPVQNPEAEIGYRISGNCLIGNKVRWAVNIDRRRIIPRRIRDFRAEK